MNFWNFVNFLRQKCARVSRSRAATTAVLKMNARRSKTQFELRKWEQIEKIAETAGTRSAPILPTFLAS